MNAAVAIALLTLLLEAGLFIDLGSLLAAAGPAAADSAVKASGCRQRSYGHDLDIRQNPGVFIERAHGSRVDVLGSRFPISSQPKTTVSFEFVAKTERGLLLHAESEDGTHELSAWIDRGRLKVRLGGRCSYFIVDWTQFYGNFSRDSAHKFTLEWRSANGASVQLDDLDEVVMPFTDKALSCWHVDNFYFGGPGPKREFAEWTRYRWREMHFNLSFSFQLVGCIRNLTLDPADSSDPSFVYRRASTCL